MPDGAQPQVSLYAQPTHPAEMVVYRGGGGNQLSADDILKLTFRGKSLKDLFTEEGSFLKPENFIVFEKKSAAETPYEVFLPKIGKILVIPFSIEADKLSYIKGIRTNKEEVNLQQFFFYADSVDRSEAVVKDLKQDKTFVLPFTTLLKRTVPAPAAGTGLGVVSPDDLPPADTFFQEKGTAPILEVKDTDIDTETETTTTTTGTTTTTTTGTTTTTPLTPGETKEENNDRKPNFPNARLIRLDNGTRVRFVDENVQEDIEELRFLDSERRIFEGVLHFDNPFIQSYLLQNKEKWVNFWKAFIHQGKGKREGLNGTSPFFYLSASKAKEVRDFFRTVQVAYEGFLLRQAKEILFKTEAYGLDKYYEFKKQRTEKGLDYSFFEARDEKKDEVTKEEEKEIKEIEDKWNVVRANYKLLLLKKQEYEANLNMLRANYEKINDEYTQAMEEYDKSENIGVSEAVRQDLEKNLKAIRINFKKSLEKIIQAGNIMNESKNILEKEVYEGISAEDLYAILEGNIQTKQFDVLKDEQNFESIKNYIDEFSKSIPLLVKEMQALSKLQAKEEEKEQLQQLAKEKIATQKQRKRQKQKEEEEEEGEEEEEEEDIDELLDEAEEFINPTQTAKPKANPKAKSPQLQKRKEQTQALKDKEVDNILNSTVSDFLVSQKERLAKSLSDNLKPPKENVILTGGRPTVQTKLMFYFLLLCKLKEYHTTKDINLEFDFAEEISKIDNYTNFVQYLQNETEDTMYIKSWKAFTLINMSDTSFNLGESEKAKIKQILSEKIHSISLIQEGKEYKTQDEIKEFISG